MAADFGGRISDPLGIVLVSKGTKADRLLFVYPFEQATATTSDLSPYITPYSVQDDPIDCYRLPVETPTRTEHGSEESYFGLPSEMLEHLFTVRGAICDQRFELKVDNTRFVGFPATKSQQPPTSAMTTMYERRLSRSLDDNDQEALTILMFNIVFVLPAEASKRCVSAYQDLSHRLAIALNGEESRCGYLTQQATIMLECRDEIATMSEAERAVESPYRLMLQQSGLCLFLKEMMDEVVHYGTVQLYLNQWIEIYFNVKKRRSLLHTASPGGGELRPFHGVLLRETKAEIIDWLPLDASGCVQQLLFVLSHLCDLEHTANNADMPLTQVLRIVDHLVQHNKATVIFPLCESNLYSISPSTSYSHTLIDSFADAFSGANLLLILSQFSPPSTLADFTDPLSHGAKHQPEREEMVVWLLRKRLIKQLHTYFTLVEMKSRPVTSLKGKHKELCAKLTGILAECPNRLPTTVSEDVTEICLQRFNTGCAENAVEESLRAFLRFATYMNGENHLEEIMYCENMRGSDILKVFDYFSPVLVTTVRPDSFLLTLQNDY